MNSKRKMHMSITKLNIKIVLTMMTCMLIIGFFQNGDTFITHADTKSDLGMSEHILDNNVEMEREVVDLGFVDLNENPFVPAIGGEEQESLRTLFEMKKYSEIKDNVRTEGVIEPTGNGQDTIGLYSDSTGSYRRSYISDGILYSGVIPFYGVENGYYKITISGYEGWVPVDAFKEYSLEAAKSINLYRVKDGDLIHYISRGANQTGASTILLGPAPKYLKEGVNYYSQDGHFFYTNLKTMIADLKVSRHGAAINANEPWYNYYQYVSHRAPSNITANNIKEYLRNKKGFTEAPVKGERPESHQSLLVGVESTFVDYGKKYGINPLLTLGTAINESNWGRSQIAYEDMNIFGHEAYDTAPESATVYDNIALSIEGHMTAFLNWQYMDVKDPTYFGGYLGDKQSGINVKYSSDPFWGEKAAEYFYIIDWNYGMKDYNQLTIGEVTSSGVPAVRKEPKTSSDQIYGLNVTGQKVTILEKVNGESVNGNTTWYKIEADPLLDSDRNLLPWNTTTRPFKAAYNTNKNYGYVHASTVAEIGGKKATEQITYKRGDLNSDGKIDTRDMMIIRRHILNIETMNRDMQTRSDLNKDGKVDTRDMMVIRRHILRLESLD